MFAIIPRNSHNSGLDLDLFNLADELVDLRPLNNLRSRVGPPTTMMRVGDLLETRDSEIQNTDKEFQVRLDLRHYNPEEVKITADDHRIVVHAKHEEKHDNNGFVSREMTRSYKVPEDVDAKSLTSTMNSQGLLSLKATKKALETPKDIPIAVEFKES